VTVIDEADHMADLGFLPGVKRLMDRTPQGTQRLLFSATLDSGVDVLIRRYLRDPVRHSVDSAASPVPKMTHHVLSVAAIDKAAVVRELVSGQGRTLAFTRTKHSARKLAKQLTAAGVPAVDLHGNLSQNARERNLSAFAQGTVRVLVATDIAARGIHIDDVALVVHVDPPAEHKAYLHRSGRTARAGATGVVVTVGTPEQAGDIRTLMRQAAITPQVSHVAVGHPMILQLTGPPAAFVAPQVVVEAAPAARPAARPTARPRRRPQSASTGRPGAGNRGHGGRPARSR
jgi:superfamily II DNA/RNA helicase